MATRARKPTHVSSRKSAQVPGQLFGYSLQPIRLLNLALDATAGTTLSLEFSKTLGPSMTPGKRSLPKRNPLSKPTR